MQNRSESQSHELYIPSEADSSHNLDQLSPPFANKRNKQAILDIAALADFFCESEVESKDAN